MTVEKEILKSINLVEEKIKDFNKESKEFIERNLKRLRRFYNKYKEKINNELSVLKDRGYSNIKIAFHDICCITKLGFSIEKSDEKVTILKEKDPLELAIDLYGEKEGIEHLRYVYEKFGLKSNLDYIRMYETKGDTDDKEDKIIYVFKKGETEKTFKTVKELLTFLDFNK